MEDNVTKINFVKNVKSMRVYQESYKVSLDIHKATMLFPKIEMFGLADQMRRASKSICANLSEGFSRQRGSKKDFKRFIIMAEGSCNEMLVWIDYCKDLGYIDLICWNSWLNTYDYILKMLTKLRSGI